MGIGRLNELCEKVWNEGMQDRSVLMRHRHILEAIADKAFDYKLKPPVIDYDGTHFTIEYQGGPKLSKSIKFAFSRLHGRAQMELNKGGAVVATVLETKTGFDILFRKKRGNRKNGK